MKRHLLDTRTGRQFLEETQRVAKVGSWEVDFVNNITLWSEVVKEIHEVESDYNPTLSEGIDFYKEGENRQKIIQAVEKAKELGELYDLELQIITAKGNERWIRTTGKPEMHQGRCIRIYGAIQDITQKKITETKLLHSKERFQSLLETVEGVVWEKDINTFHTTFMSERVKNFTGYQPELWVSQPGFWEDHIFPDDREKVLELFHSLKDDPRNVILNYRLIKADGSVHWVRDRITVIHENGKPKWIRGLMVDITESKKIEEELSRSEALLKSLVEELHTSNERYEYINRTTNDAIFDWDIRKSQIHWGDGFFRLFGYHNPPETFFRQSLAPFIHPLDRDQVMRDFNALLDDGLQNSWTKEYRFRKFDGAYAHVEDSSYVIRDDKGHPIRMIGALRDISFRKLNETKMNALHEKLERNLKVLEISNTELEQFAHVVSHDLQEPLRMITGFLSQLERRYGEAIDDKGKQYIFYAVEGAKRMRQIILDLLNFSKVSQLDDDPEEVDLNVLISDILILYKRKIEEKNATVAYEGLPTLYTVKTPMRLIFQNLISNGLIYQGKNNKPHIKISCEEKDGFWEFTVADNGIGIDQLSYDKIFIIFQRLQHSEDFPGTGMGLSVVKKILESSGGSIWVESECGKGSKFHFTVPKKQAPVSIN